MNIMETNPTKHINIAESIIVYRNCDVCGRCYQNYSDNTDINDSDYFGDAAVKDSKIGSHFGRKKRDASSRRIRKTSQEKCIRFSIR
jgi:hypothetical protein